MYLLLFQVSNQIYAGLLSCISKLHIVLDDQESLVALYQLLSSMDPVTVNIQVQVCIGIFYMLSLVDSDTLKGIFYCFDEEPKSIECD